jgi:hypothetical protein
VESGDWFLGDDPVDGTAGAPDLLDRTGYVDHVIALLEGVRRRSPSSVLGLTADWGAGKSSIMKMVRIRLTTSAEDQAWLIAEYNPWSYSGLEGLIQGFFSELRAAMPKEARWNEARQRIAELAEAAGPFGKLSGPSGGDSGSALWAAGRSMAGANGISAAKRAAEDILTAMHSPMLVILDDLDRLAPDELLLVFKLVRLLGRLPNIYYLLCYDEKTLLDVLGRSELIGDDPRRIRDYMEKMVQARIDLPPLRDAQQDAAVDAAISAIVARNQVQLGPDDIDRIAQAYRSHLKSCLMTPRAINRFFGQVDSFYAVMNQEIDFVDHLIVTFLRTTEYGVYRMLQRHRAELTGTHPYSLPGASAVPGREAIWRQRVADAGVLPVHVDGVTDLLALLFEPVRAANGNTTPRRVCIENIGLRRGVGHADYFDRYFALSAPTGNVASTVVTEAMRHLRDGTEGYALEQFTEQLLRDTERIVQKVRTQREEEYVPAAPLIGLLAKIYARVPSGHVFTSRPDHSVLMLTCDLLRDLPAAEGEATIRAMACSDGGAILAIRAIRNLRRPGPSAAVMNALRFPWIGDAEIAMHEIVTSRLAQALSQPLKNLPGELFRELIWGWHDLDKGEVTAWLRAQVAECRWGLLDVLAKYITFDLAGSSETLPQHRLGAMSLGEVDELFGLDNILEQLKPQIDSASEAGRWISESAPDPAKRYILWTLRTVRDRRVRDIAGLQIPTAEVSDPFRVLKAGGLLMSR